LARRRILGGDEADLKVRTTNVHRDSEDDHQCEKESKESHAPSYLNDAGCVFRHASYRMRSVFTGFRFSPSLIAFGPRSDPGCETVRYIAYLPLLCESPFVSMRSAIRM